MKGLTMVQWINLNRNYRSVVAHQYSALREKTGPMLLLLMDLTAGWLANWLADEMWVDFKIFKFSAG